MDNPNIQTNVQNGGGIYKKIIGIVITVLVIIILLGGITLSVFMFSKTTNSTNHVTSGKIDVDFDAGNGFSGAIYPSNDKSGGISNVSTIKLNTGSIPVKANIYLDVSSISGGIATTSLKWEVYKDNDTTIYQSGNFDGVTNGDKINLVNNYTLSTTLTTFTIYVWLDGNTTGNEVEGATFSASLSSSSSGLTGDRVYDYANGMILHYDAINNTNYGHSDNATTWYDLSGNNNNGTLSGGEWSDNSLYLDSNSEVNTGLTASNVLPAEGTWTINAVFKINEWNTNISSYTVYDRNQGMIFGTASYSFAGIGWDKLYTDTNGTIISYYRCSNNVRQLSINSGVEAPTKIYDITISFNFSEGYMRTYENGVLVINNTISNGNGCSYRDVYQIIRINGPAALGGNPRGASTPMTIYSAKIYNRALTDEEVLNNYNVDKIRYNIN